LESSLIILSEKGKYFTFIDDFTGNANNLQNTIAYCSSATNVPVGYGIIISFVRSWDQSGYQLYIKENKLYVRAKSNNTWQAWKSVALS
jgi:hypothetical protein